MTRSSIKPIPAALDLKGGETITFSRERERAVPSIARAVVDPRYLPDEQGELMAQAGITMYVLNVADILAVEPAPADPTIGQEIQYYRAAGVGGQKVSATVTGFQRLEPSYLRIDVETPEGDRFSITNYDIVGRIFG